MRTTTLNKNCSFHAPIPSNQKLHRPIRIKNHLPWLLPIEKYTPNKSKIRWACVKTLEQPSREQADGAAAQDDAQALCGIATTGGTETTDLGFPSEFLPIGEKSHPHCTLPLAVAANRRRSVPVPRLPSSPSTLPWEAARVPSCCMT